jgi:hypothetical protein
VKDNWNFSRSNLFNYLPFFHLGVRATYALSKSFSVTAAVYNGYNQATDLNDAKSVSVQTSFLTSKVLFNLLYLGGKERAAGDPAGRPWRHLFDAVLQYDATPVLSLGANADAGFERGKLGTGGWLAAALYARLKLTPYLYFAARGDGIYEFVPDKAGVDGDGMPITVRSPIFFGGGDHVLSSTFTLELRPIDGISFRIEYRHDDSDRDVPLFYKKGLDANGAQLVARSQNTVTFGMTGWF